MNLSWAVVGVSLMLVVLMSLVLGWQVLLRREALDALRRCRAHQKKLQAILARQQAELRETSAGLRAEKTHVEQLQRRLELVLSQS